MAERKEEGSEVARNISLIILTTACMVRGTVCIPRIQSFTESRKLTCLTYWSTYADVKLRKRR